MRNCFARRLDLIEVCERNVLSGFRAHSSITKTEASALLDQTTKSANKFRLTRHYVDKVFPL